MHYITVSFLQLNTLRVRQPKTYFLYYLQKKTLQKLQVVNCTILKFSSSRRVRRGSKYKKINDQKFNFLEYLFIFLPSGQFLEKTPKMLKKLISVILGPTVTSMNLSKIQFYSEMM